MKKLLVFSDSHGNVANMADTVRLEQPDGILHLGDLVRDAQRLGEQFPQIPLLFVPGNCDGRRSDLPQERVFTQEGCRIMMAHGHQYHVKMGRSAAESAARQAGANILLFGHTHEPVWEFVRGLWIVNPGSAGSLAAATYAVICLEEDGAVCYISRI